MVHIKRKPLKICKKKKKKFMETRDVYRVWKGKMVS